MCAYKHMLVTELISGCDAQCIMCAYKHMLVTELISGCDVQCTICDQNGANKCDTDHCNSGYGLATADNTCQRKAIL